MSIPPVIVRELRAESRNAVNSWLRVVGASIAILVLMVLLLSQNSLQTIDPIVFQSLHATIVLLIWLLVPAMTADCIARERREGTLGLLFLTPLTARGIVVGKASVHFLRSLTFLLAAIPMLTIPLLLGGVTWIDFVSASLIELSSVLLALTAGVLASTFCKNATRALLLAAILAGIAIVIIATFVQTCFGSTSSFYQLRGSFQTAVSYDISSGNSIRAFLRTLALLLGNGWKRFSAPGMGNLRTTWFFTLGSTLVFSFVLFRVALAIGARRIKRHWQDESISVRQRWLLKHFCTPDFFKSFFKRKMSHALQANPIGWLQQYSWSARLSKWGWCLFIVLAESLLTCEGGLYSAQETQAWLALALVFGATFSAAGSFRQERQNGALELLLVTPLTEQQIIMGRLWGMWKQMLPAAIIFFVAAIGFAETSYSYRAPDMSWLFGVATTFLTVPIIGLFFSLRIKNYLASWMVIFTTSLLVPYLSIALLAYVSERLGVRLLHRFSDALIFMILVQLSFAIAAGVLLFRNLKQRTFALSGA